MGQLIYSAIGSLDGYIADRDGDFSWAEPDEEVHQYANDMLLGVDLHLYGRTTYDLMTVWETDPAFAAASRLYAEFAQRWIDADKVVYSSTLEEPVTRRTRLERTFDPDAVRELKESTPGGIMIAGPTVAAEAFRAGLVDVVDQVLLPVTIGGGLAVYPGDLRLDLELLDERRFACGAVAVRHRVLGVR
ncbi:MAG: dihydrofolate reductase family protein [Citricoccus sp.]